MCSLKCKQTVQHNAYDQDPYAKEFGIKISEKLASVEARVLPAPWVRPSLFYGEFLNGLLIAPCLSAAEIS